MAKQTRFVYHKDKVSY